MLSAEVSTDMDRITQLQDAILDLLTLTHTSIEYITTRTAFVQPSPAFPRTTVSEASAPPAEYRATIQNFVADIVQRAKDVEVLIAALPHKDDGASTARSKTFILQLTVQVTRLTELQDEMLVANAEYKEALAQAESLLAEVETALGAALETTTARDPLLGPIAADLKAGLASARRREGASSQADLGAGAEQDKQKEKGRQDVDTTPQ